MHVSFDKVVPAQPPDAFPIRLEQSTSGASVLLRLLLLVPALVALAVPLMLLAAHAVAEPKALAFLADHPLSSVQIALAAAIWSILFVWPLQRLVARAGRTRIVDILQGKVAVTEQGLLRTRAWSEPLASYRGLAHHVRTSLSGVRHEIILVHPDPARHVLLAVREGISAEAVARTAALLGLGQVHARELYAFERSQSTASLSAPHLVPANG